MLIINSNNRGQVTGDRCLLSLIMLFLLLFSGCSSNTETQARKLISQSQENYGQAVTIYKKLIEESNDPVKIHLKLGKLYYEHGEFVLAVDELKNLDLSEAKKILGISFYRLGSFTDALEIFNKAGFIDDEAFYYHGLTCEELNLFDRSLSIYEKIKDPIFKGLALSRKENINKESSNGHISEISPQTAAIINKAPDASFYPQAGAMILSSSEEIEIKNDLTMRSRMHYTVKILNERGKEDFSEAQVDYDSTYEKVELVFARVIRPDGTVVEVGSKHLRDVSKYMNFPLYSNARVFIISFPEITENAVIEYEVEVSRSQLINKKDFMLNYPLQGSEPIISADFVLKIPKEMKAAFKYHNQEYNNFNADLTPKIKEDEMYLTYRWGFVDIPQIVPETNMPPGVEINTAIMLSTFSSWDEIYKWWWALAKDKIKPDTAISEKVSQLVTNKENDEEKIRAIYNFCAQKIRYVAVEYGDAGYEPHKATDIFRNKYGDCKDQAILLVTMLRDAGFAAYPVLIATRQYYNLDSQFPSMLFNHCIAVVLVGTEFVFMDPTAETTSFRDLPVDDQDRRVLLIKDEGYEIKDIPMFPGEHNSFINNISLSIEKDESVNGAKIISTNGLYAQAQRYWLLYTPPEIIEETIKERLQEVSVGAALIDYELKNQDNLNKPVELRYRFKGPEYLTAAGDMRIMPQLSNFNAALVAKDKRRYPIDLGALDLKETKIEINIPEDFMVKYLPGDIEEDTPWFNFRINYQVEGKKVIFKETSLIKKYKISLQEYRAFKEAFQKLAKNVKQRIVFVYGKR